MVAPIFCGIYEQVEARTTLGWVFPKRGQKIRTFLGKSVSYLRYGTINCSSGPTISQLLPSQRLIITTWIINRWGSLTFCKSTSDIQVRSHTGCETSCEIPDPTC